MPAGWIIALAAAGLVASFAGAALGIGGGLVVMPLLSLWLPPQQAVAYAAPMFLAASAVNFWRYRHDVARPVLWRYIPLVGVGSVLGAHFLKIASPMLVRVLMGTIALTFAGLEGLRLVRLRPLRAGYPWLAWPLSFAGGLASTLTNIGGTVVSAAMLGESLSQSVYVATLNAVMLAMGVFKVSLFSLEGLIHVRGLAAALPSIPAVLVGSWMGKRLNQKLSPGAFRWILVTVIGASSVLLLVGA